MLSCRFLHVSCRNPKIDNDGYLKRDEKKYTIAYRNHNSGIDDLALERFLNTFSDDLSWLPIWTLHADLRKINSYKIEISSSPLKTEVINLLLRVLQDEQYDDRFIVVWILEELRAADALVQVFKHRDKLTRYLSAFSLLKVKASGAVEFISQFFRRSRSSL